MSNRRLSADEASDHTRWQAFAICVGVASLTILDLAKINVGLPPIEEALGAGPTELQIIVAGYALAFGLALVPSGRFGDLHSRKAMFVVGLSLFTVASLMCALAPNVTVLIVGRIVQGIAAGVQMPQVLGLIQQLFVGAERGRAFGLFGAVIGISTAFAPTLGGFLIGVGGQEDGWRWLFWMNIPLGIAALLFAIKLLPSIQAHDEAGKELDLVGILLLGLATFSLMLPFVLTTGAPSDDPRRWFWLAGSVVALAAFVLWERAFLARGKSPVLHVKLLRLASYRNGLMIATAWFAGIPAMFLIATLFLQTGLGLEPVYAGMVSILFALASAVTAWIGGNLVERHGRRLVVAGIVAALAGLVLVLLAGVALPPEQAPWFMALAMALAGAGGGFVISPNQTLTLQDVSLGQAGVAGSLTQVAQRVGTAIGVAGASAMFFSTIYREAGEESRLTVYHDALRNGMLVCIGVLVVALVVSLVDLRRRVVAAETDEAA
ncbi:MFS transporter [Lysobacter korlensis]|uniref:MFS transporter n=1 Tax=Lysobacter korlensis TaxID=553636 RepID=A0ABV6RVU9_9GAMM